MGRKAEFVVEAWWAWSPDRMGENAWRKWAGQPHVEPSGSKIGNGDGSKLPLRLRRRITPIGQQMLASGLTCLRDIPDLSFVFASATAR